MRRARSRPGQGLGGAALLGVWLAGAAAAGAGQPLHTADGRTRLDLVWFDPLNVVPSSVDSIGHEVRHVFQDLGMETTWTAGTADIPTAPPQVNVVFLAALPSPTLPANTLGVVSAGPGGRTLWIVVPHVLRTLGVTSAPQALRGREAAAVARALGRVVAHEVVHLAAPRLGHTRDGLMQASLGRTDLTSGRLRLDVASRRAVLPALARLADPAIVTERIVIAG